MNSSNAGPSEHGQSVRSTGVDTRASSFWLGGYALLLVGLVTLMVSSWFASTEFSFSMQLIFLALAVLTIKRWTGAILLALIQVHLLFLPSWAAPAAETFADLVYVCLPLALVSLVSRYRSIQDFEGGSPTQALDCLLRKLREDRGDRSQVFVDHIRRQLRQLVCQSVVIVLCLTAAVWLLSLVPLPPNRSVLDTIREFRLRPTGYRTLVVGLSLFAGWLPIWLIMNEVTWRSYLSSQARLYLRGIFADWHHRDLRSIVRRRLKSRLAGRSSVEKSAAKPNPSPTDPFSEPTMGFEGRVL